MNDLKQGKAGRCVVGLADSFVLWGEQLGARWARASCFRHAHTSFTWSSALHLENPSLQAAH